MRNSSATHQRSSLRSDRASASVDCFKALRDLAGAAERFRQLAEQRGVAQ